MHRTLLIFAAALGLAGLASAQDPSATETPHVKARLVAETEGVQPGGTVSVALRLDIIEHWHTYWIYAGDSGEGTAIDWTLPEGVTAGPLQFPIRSASRSGLWSISAMRARSFT
jgi:thiol:disulfide interchange protein DsbD